LITRILNLFNIYSSNDNSILKGIRLGGAEKRKAENLLFEKYNYFINHGAKKFNILLEEASIVYSDAILTVIDHIKVDKFESKASLKTYLNQIFYNQCVSFIRKKTTKKATSTYDTVLLDNILEPLHDESQNIISQIIQKEEESDLMERILKIGEKCKELLMLWAEGNSDKEIVNLLAYASVDVVKVSRMRCMAKLKGLYN
jgi:RNA polymerase sigma factor (sigma-70 family)